MLFIARGVGSILLPHSVFSEDSVSFVSILTLDLDEQRSPFSLYTCPTISIILTISQQSGPSEHGQYGTVKDGSFISLALWCLFV
jgi:hypothetical protein